MALVSDIEIRLRADIARLQQDMDRARQQVGGAMSKITQLAKGAAGALAAIGAGMAVGALANFVKSAIDATDAVSDISQRTGVAIKDIAGLQLWFQIGGAEAGEFESSMIKLAKTISTGGDAFNKIGVATRNADGSLRSNMQVLLDAGDAFQKLEDGTAKTALAIELFGKSGATLIPILNSGSEGLREMTEMADKLGLTFDQESVDAAGKFNDTLDFLGLAAQGVGRQLAAQLLPALNSVAGSFLDFVVKGDGVKKMAAGISAVLKTLYTVGVGVYTVFKTVGNTLAAAAAQVVAILTGDFQAATNIGKIWKEEVAADFTSAAKTITDVWNDAGGETVAALAGMGKKGSEIAAKATKDAKQQADAYASLLRSLQDRVDATGRELDGLLPLNEAEKAHLDLARQITDGKLKLSAAQEGRARDLINEARANEVLTAATKDYDALLEQLAKNARDLASERASLIKSAEEEAEQNERLVETFGMTESAIMFLQAARLKEQEVQRLGRDLTGEEIADLNRVIELKERSAKAVASKRELEEAKQFWTDIDKTARDTFVSITDGGKNAFQRLKDTAKNVFFDWLYQQTIKKWIINIQAQTPGTDILGSALGSIGANKDMLQKIGTTIGGFVLGSGVTKALSGGRDAGSGVNALTSINTALTSYIAGPLGGAIAGVIGGVINRAFGRGPKEYADNSTLNGMLGAGGFSGTVDTAWKQKGGWFRSSKSGFDSAQVGSEVAEQYAAAYDAIKASSAEYAKALGLNADAINNRAQAVKIALGKDEAANQKAIADFFVGVADTVAGEILPNIAKFQQAGESASATLERVAVNFTAVEQILMALGTDSQTAFRAVGVASLEARERLVALTGGIESFAQQASFFNQNFLSQAEQIAIISGPLNKQLEELGYAGITSAEQFKDAVQTLVQSGALATEQGAKTYAGLLAIAPQFKTVADYLKELSDAAAETARNAKDAADALLAQNEANLRAAVDAAFSGVQRSVEAERDTIVKNFDVMMSAIGSSIESVSGRVSDLTSLSQALRGAMGVVSSDAQQAASRSAARAQVQSAIAIAKASGVLPSADSLKDALAALGQDSGDQFSTLADYQREVARTNLELETLGGMSDAQLTEAQRQLRLLESQRTDLQVQHDAEMLRLDGILLWAQAEVDALNGIDRSIQSLSAAISTLKAATQAASANVMPENSPNTNLSVSDLYRTVLGREGEQAGIEFWKAAFGDVVDAKEYADFLKGAAPELEMQERQRRQAEAANGTMSGTMSSSSESGQQVEFNRRMEAMQAQQTAAIQRMSDQFNQVSGGGNALISEFA